ncbi:MAG: sugar phosphate isomerase/epimerase [Kiritimatiellae bacterium]|nr:sugar phosphate isomerase/epimerase [Kiritimatiellia bacterium]
MDYTDRIYIGTVLLERNRWSSREPSFQVSDWARRMAEAGFDGIELWQNHAVKATEQEREKLKGSPCPVTIFNSYAGCEDEQRAEREEAVQLARFFSARGMKYNFGRDKARHAAYRTNVRDWREALPASFRFLCECHGGSSMEEPEIAAATFDALGNGGYEAIVHVMNREEGAVRRWFERLGARITHAHVALSGPGPNERGAICLSQDPEFVRSRMGLLRELGYRGSYTIEFTEGVRGHEDRERLFENAVADMAFLRECLGKY